MLQNVIVSYSSRRGVFKLAAILAGMAILLAGAVEKVGDARSFLWMAAPLLLLGLAEAGLAAEQRRCWELLEKNDDVSILPTESMGACVMRFIFAVLSFSIWPFYLALFGLLAFGGGEIAKANKEAAAQAAQNVNAAMTAQPWGQQLNGMATLPGMPQRPPNNAFSPIRPPLDSSGHPITPPPFPTPQHFPILNRGVTPPRMTPTTAPVSPSQGSVTIPISPVPGAKNP